MTLLSRYLMLATFRTVAIVALALTGLFSLLEFVEQLASVGQGHYRVVDAFLYVLLTAPSRLLQAVPISMLLGSLLTLGALSRNAEIAAMLSLGMSEYRIVGAVLCLVMPLAIALLLVMQFVIPPAQQMAQERRTSALFSSVSLQGDNSFWAQNDRQYLNVQEFQPGNIPIGIDIYAFNVDGSLASIIHAGRADIRPDGTWLLTEVSRRRVYASQIRTDHLASLSWQSFMPSQQLQFLLLAPESIPPIGLWRHIRSLEQHHQNAARYRQALWAKASLLLSMIAMVMIAAPFVFGSPRAQSNGQQLVRGVAFGIVFSLGQQILNRLGLLLDVAPAVTTLAPPLLVMVVAACLFRRAYRPRWHRLAPVLRLSSA